MARFLQPLLSAALPLSFFLLASCASEPEKKPVPPTTETSRIPWNQPLPGQGQGQFGMMPQNQYRR
jgi:hypothetical protein